MCDFLVYSPEGQQWKLTFPEQVLLKMTVRCFTEELVKLVATVYTEYTKHNIGLIVGNKRLDDFSISSQTTAAQKLKEANGGLETPVPIVTREPTVVEMLREVNGGSAKAQTVVQMVRKVNGG